MQALIILVLIGFSSADLYRRGLGAYENAKCADGSEGVYHSSNYTGQKNYVLFMMGGGFCHTLQSCQERCEGGSFLCESDMSPTIGQGGLLSDDPSVNPTFHSYFKAHLHYCNGDLHAGTRVASNETNNMWFTGRYNALGMVRDMITNYGLGDAEEVVISGTSAGAFGAVGGCIYVREFLPRAKVICLPDSLMLFPNISYFEPNCEGPMEIFAQGRRLWGIPEGQNLTTLNWWTAIDEPLMLAHPMYDNVAHILYCADPSDDNHMRQWQNGIYDYIAMLQQHRPNTALWVPGCFQHGYLQSDSLFNEQRVGPQNMTLSEALTAFKQNTNRPLHVVDRCTANNITCGDC